MKLTFRPRTFSALRTFATRTFAGGADAVFYHVVRIGETVEVTVTTTMSDVVWYFWYADGAYLGKTAGPTKTFQVPAGEQLRLDCVPTDQEDYDPLADPPEGYPSRRTLWWTRSLSADAAEYRIDQREGTDEWTTIAVVPQEIGKWDISIITGRLNDLTEYTWRIVALDAAGNESVPLTIGPERIVRRPDAPNFAVEFDTETERVTFSV